MNFICILRGYFYCWNESHRCFRYRKCIVETYYLCEWALFLKHARNLSKSTFCKLLNTSILILKAEKRVFDIFFVYFTVQFYIYCLKSLELRYFWNENLILLLPKPLWFNFKACLIKIHLCSLLWSSIKECIRWIWSFLWK